MNIDNEIRNLRESMSLAKLVKDSLVKRQVHGLEFISVNLDSALDELETTLNYIEAVYEIDEDDERRLVNFKKPEKPLC